MKRKDFLLFGTLGAISLSAPGCVIASENKNSKQGDPSNQTSFKGDCTTTDDILGPFYRKNAPIRTDLTYPNHGAVPVTVLGKVYGEDCITPIENALVEIWHCNTEGEYDNDTNEFRLRASQKSRKNGAYEFNTIFPGKYLNGREYRPAHMHFRVTAPNSTELISQIYFKGDPYIEKDHWASQAKAQARILEIVPDAINGGISVIFDIYLAGKS